MAVDLEGLVMKSVEQYAAFGVRLGSIEASLLDINRRSEAKEEKFIAACDRLSRLDEKLTAIVEDKVVVHRRIDEVKITVESLTKMLQDLAMTVRAHTEDHCDNCINEGRIQALDERVEEAVTIDKDLAEVRALATSKWGLTFTRFIVSRVGQVFIALVTADLLLDFVAHYDFIKNLWSWMNFKE